MAGLTLTPTVGTLSGGGESGVAVGAVTAARTEREKLIRLPGVKLEIWDKKIKIIFWSSSLFRDNIFLQLGEDQILSDQEAMIT